MKDTYGSNNHSPLLMKHRQSSLLRAQFIKVYCLLHAYYHTNLVRVEFFLWRDSVFWQKENLVLSFKLKMPEVRVLCSSKWLLNWISFEKMDKNELSHVIFRGICSWAGWHVIDSICKAFWNRQHDKKQNEKRKETL